MICHGETMKRTVKILASAILAAAFAAPQVRAAHVVERIIARVNKHVPVRGFIFDVKTGKLNEVRA